MTDCPRLDLRDRLPEWIRGSLRERARAEVEMHLATCAECRAEAELLRAARAALAAEAPRVHAERIAAAVRAGGAHGAAHRARGAGWRSGFGIVALAASLVAVAVLSRAERPPRIGTDRGARPTSPATGAPAAGARSGETAPATVLPDSAAGRPAPSVQRDVPPGAASELSIGAGIGELGDDELRLILERLEQVDRLPDADAARLLSTFSEGTR